MTGYDAGGAEVVDLTAGSFSARIKQLADADGLVPIPVPTFVECVQHQRAIEVKLHCCTDRLGKVMNREYDT